MSLRYLKVINIDFFEVIKKYLKIQKSLMQFLESTDSYKKLRNTAPTVLKDLFSLWTFLVESDFFLKNHLKYITNFSDGFNIWTLLLKNVAEFYNFIYIFSKNLLGFMKFSTWRTKILKFLKFVKIYQNRKKFNEIPWQHRFAKKLNNTSPTALQDIYTRQRFLIKMWFLR